MRYRWVTLRPAPPAPSPKSHVYIRGPPSGSRPDAVNRTSSGALPLIGSAAIWTVGAWLAGGLPTVIDTVALSDSVPSLTVSFAV